MQMEENSTTATDAAAIRGVQLHPRPP